MSELEHPSSEEMLKELEDLDLDGELPEEVQNLSSSSDDDTKGKAAHAFKRLKDGLKIAKGVITQMSEEAATRKKEQAAGQAGVRTPAPNAALQEAQYMTSLQQRAMQSTGNFNPNSKLVEMEMDRHYARDMERVERQQTAEGESVKVLEETWEQHPFLDEGDRKAIQETLSSWNVLDRADLAVVKAEVNRYVGEHLDKFRGTSSTNGDTSADASGKGVAPGAAAASSVKSQGNKGVAPGQGAGGDKTSVKPATAEESRKMKTLGIPPERVDLLRKAEAKKGKYT